MTLAASIRKGSYTENDQVNRSRKTLSCWYGSIHEAGVGYIGAPRTGSDVTGEDFTMTPATTGKLFQHRATGMRLRMGVLKFQNKALASWT